MKLCDFIAAMEEIAPVSLAEEYDNPGLIIGTTRKEIKKVLVALDCTVETANEAAEAGADLLLVHHPLFFTPVKHILPDDPETAAAFIMVQNNIALFAAHTNLDAANGGVNDCLAKLAGLTDIIPIPGDELGRIGTLQGAPVTAAEFAKRLSAALGTDIGMCDCSLPVHRVALVGGGGGGDIYCAKAAGADTFITGEAKHHQLLHARTMGLNLMVAGHYESERIVLEPLIEYLQARTNDVQYNLTRSERPCLVSVTE